MDKDKTYSLTDIRESSIEEMKMFTIWAGDAVFDLFFNLKTLSSDHVKHSRCLCSRPRSHRGFLEFLQMARWLAE